MYKLRYGNFWIYRIKNLTSIALSAAKVLWSHTHGLYRQDFGRNDAIIDYLTMSYKNALAGVALGIFAWVLRNSFLLCGVLHSTCPQIQHCPVITLIQSAASVRDRKG